MATGEEIKAHNNCNSGISNDGMDDIPDHRNGKDSSSDMGSLQYIRDIKGKEKQ